jgi:hypothetical protein
MADPWEQYKQAESSPWESYAPPSDSPWESYATKDPSLGQVAAGVGTEVATGIGGQMAGTALGATIGSAVPVVGTAVGAGVGYTVGSLGSGIAGSIAAQKIEGRDDISWGRAIAAGLINLVPGGLGKGAKGAATVGKVAAREATKGAAFGATEATSRAIIDEKRLPTVEELAQYGGAGAMFGGALGAGGNILGRKLAGKTTGQIDDDIAKGFIKEEDLSPIFNKEDAPMFSSEFRKTRDALHSDMAAQAIADKDAGAIGRVLASVAPSRFVGREAQQTAIDYQRRIKSADELGSKIADRVEKQIAKNPDIAQRVDDYITGAAPMDKATFDAIGPELEKYRELRREFQQEMVDLLDSDAYARLKPEQAQALQKTIQDSLDTGSYNRREYKMFLDKNYSEDPKLKDAALKELTQKFGSEEEALKHMDMLREGSARRKEYDPRNFFGGGVDSMMKRRHNPGDAERKWLGEIVESPEKMRGTLTGLARSVSRAKADQEIGRQLVDAGVASPTQKGNMIEVQLRGTGPEGTGIYATPEVQVALNQIYLPSSDKGTENIFLRGLQDMYSAGVGASKASKVLLNTIAYPVQFYGNTANLSGMGINPFRGAARGGRIAAMDVPILRDIMQTFGGNTPKARQAILNDIDEMGRYGIKNANVLESDIRKTLEDGVFSGMLNKAVDPLGKAYSVPDTMGRYVGWKAMQNKLRNIFPELSEDELKRRAAIEINDTYQNYDKLSNTVRSLSRWGVMPQFASFTSEFARNQYNQGRIIKDLLSGNYNKDLLDALPPERRAQAVSAMRKEGAKRLAALTAVYGTTWGAVEGVKAATGVDEDKEAALRDVVYDPWDKDRNVMVKLNEDGNTGWTANPSYISPHAIGISAMKAGLSGEGEESVIGLIADEFVGEGSFVMQEAFRALQNKSEQGKPISNELNALRSAQDRMSYFIRETFKPGVSKEIEKLNKIRLGEGDLTLKELGARQLGLRTNPFEINKAAQSTIRGNNEAAKGAKAQYNSLKKYGNASPAELAQSYEKANRINQEAFEALSRNNKSLATLGRSEEERIEIMQKAGVSSRQIIDILSGTYTALPRDKEPTTSEVYDSLPQGQAAKMREIKKIAKDNPEMAKRLRDTVRRERATSKMSAKDRLLMRMSVDERTRYIMRQKNPKGFMRTLSPRIVTESVRDAVMRSK